MVLLLVKFILMASSVGIVTKMHRWWGVRYDRLWAAFEQDIMTYEKFEQTCNRYQKGLASLALVILFGVSWVCSFL